MFHNSARDISHVAFRQTEISWQQWAWIDWKPAASKNKWGSIVGSIWVLAMRWVEKWIQPFSVSHRQFICIIFRSEVVQSKISCQLRLLVCTFIYLTYICWNQRDNLPKIESAPLHWPLTPDVHPGSMEAFSLSWLSKTERTLPLPIPSQHINNTTCSTLRVRRHPSALNSGQSNLSGNADVNTMFSS